MLEFCSKNFFTILNAHVYAGADPEEMGGAGALPPLTHPQNSIISSKGQNTLLEQSPTLIKQSPTHTGFVIMSICYLYVKLQVSCPILSVIAH